MKQSELRYHIAFGRHSNIPECCITEWILNLNAHGSNVEINRDKKRRLIAAHGENLYYSIQYVMCESCIRTLNISKIHKCNDSCYKQFREWKFI